MKGQFSRLTARRARRYSSVRLQQGRVHLDADFNEQVDIGAWRDRVTTRDVVGPTGAPVEGGGFALSPVVALTGLDAVGSSLRAVGTRGTVLASGDGGATWAPQPVPPAVAERDLLAVDQFDLNTAVATTSAGEILFQANGSTWTIQTPAAASGSALHGAQLLSATTAWVVGAGGLILGTTNAGGTWATRTAAGVTEALRAVHFASATAGWAVGDGARIVRTSDAGATWAPQAAPAGASARLNAVRFAPDALHGWAVGEAATIFTTPDGGATWIARSGPPGVDATLRGLDVVSTTTAWAVGDGGTVLRTTDGGTTWELVPPSAAVAVADLRAVRAQSAATARVAGDLSTLASVSIAGGTANWQPSPTLPGRDLAISPGRMYLDGILVENDRAARYLTQLDLLGTTVPAAGTYRAYLDVWTRHLTALDRPELREVALGGPDTSTRTQTIWQVRIDPATLPGTTTCADIPADWTPAAAPTGRLRARGAPMPVTSNDCLVPAGGGYRRLENLLYRVEIQTPGPAGTATFKWSRENGSVAARLAATDPAATAKTVTIADPGRAPDGDFAGAAFIEITDDRRILAGEPGVLLPVLGVTGTVIRVQTAPPAMSAFGAGALVRRWDGTGNVVAGGWRPLATTDAAVPEDGVDVEFGTGTYSSGDHWTIPARTLVGDVEWPRRGGAPTFVARDGDDHRYTPLAIVTVDATGAIAVVEDCRTLFPPLGGLETLLYVSGDGQEIPHGASLQLLDAAVVGVTRGPIPVRYARVRFHVEGGGTIDGVTPDKVVATDAAGLARVNWTLADGIAPQHLTAELLDAADARLGTPVRFQARVRSAATVSYEPSCPAVAGTTTVQEAIDALCDTRGNDPGIHVGRLTLLEIGDELRNDTTVLVDDLGKGIRVDFDGPIDGDSVREKPTCFVTIEMPYPLTSADRSFWDSPTIVAYQPLVLAASTSAQEASIDWQPEPPTLDWLRRVLGTLMELGLGHRVLARFTIQGNFIWSSKDPRLLVDGDSFGAPDGGRTDLARDAAGLLSGDRRRGGDFRMWFWLGAERVRHFGNMQLVPVVKSQLITTPTHRRVVPRAMGFAIDRSRAHEILGDDFEFDPEGGFDPEASKQMLAEVGIEGGRGIVATEPRLRPVIEILASGLADIGFELEVVVVEDLVASGDQLFTGDRPADLVFGTDTDIKRLVAAVPERLATKNAVRI